MPIRILAQGRPWESCGGSGALRCDALRCDGSPRLTNLVATAGGTRRAQRAMTNKHARGFAQGFRGGLPLHGPDSSAGRRRQQLLPVKEWAAVSERDGGTGPRPPPRSSRGPAPGSRYIRLYLWSTFGLSLVYRWPTSSPPAAQSRSASLARRVQVPATCGAPLGGGSPALERGWPWKLSAAPASAAGLPRTVALLLVTHPRPKKVRLASARPGAAQSSPAGYLERVTLPVAGAGRQGIPWIPSPTDGAALTPGTAPRLRSSDSSVAFLCGSWHESLTSPRRHRQGVEVSITYE
ncbi:hypothetical protein CDD83_7059 [Cordyceps sp. RAO-2017]|nr:hypothetical protein CDD83_7059 [Cordyceps sp. RAO-2017]